MLNELSTAPASVERDWFLSSEPFIPYHNFAGGVKKWQGDVPVSYTVQGAIPQSQIRLGIGAALSPPDHPLPPGSASTGRIATFQTKWRNKWKRKGGSNSTCVFLKGFNPSFYGSILKIRIPDIPAFWLVGSESEIILPDSELRSKPNFTSIVISDPEQPQSNELL
jgi:hypothetical protein